MQMNPYLMENIMDLMIYILSPIINSEDFDIFFGLCLNQGFEIFEVLKDLWFFPEKEYPCEAWEFINKNEYVPHFTNWWMRKRSHEVTMDQI